MDIKDLYHIGGMKAITLESIGMIHRRILRPYLPETNLTPEFSGINVPSAEVDSRYFDQIVPWATPGNRKWHEHDLIKVARSTISRGIRVIVVGGGTGASTVHCAREVDSLGEILVFEASSEMAEICRRTINANSTPCPVTVRNQTVGEAVKLYGDDAPSDTVSPIELPEADVMVLDCEGAEKEIISSEYDLPNKLVVETHGVFGATTEEVEKILINRGYKVQRVGNESITDDVRILRAEKEEPK